MVLWSVGTLSVVGVRNYCS